MRQYILSEKNTILDTVIGYVQAGKLESAIPAEHKPTYAAVKGLIVPVLSALKQISAEKVTAILMTQDWDSLLAEIELVDKPLATQLKAFYAQAIQAQMTK